jgi:hypothetical protein
MYQFNIYTPHAQYPMFVTTDVNLLEMYKAALITGAKQIMWEKGIVDITQIIGIFDVSAPPTVSLDNKPISK